MQVPTYEKILVLADHIDVKKSTFKHSQRMDILSKTTRYGLQGQLRDRYGNIYSNIERDVFGDTQYGLTLNLSTPPSGHS